MDDPVQFLRARLAEEAERAQLALRQDDPEHGWAAYRPDGQQHTTIVPHVGMIHEAIQAEHIVRWNPARVLAEVDAKRRIVDTCEEALADDNGMYFTGWAHGLGRAVCLLALPYADHPDYREEWRPTD
ncbi:DUF6221 family protein [Streptomyces xanthophaeus]|uniref:DUF6221 family protein n=1 Tax=Streptomyces xanthophaeus TaxID=67385 RepID=UPI002647561A|nr:DUF6221 family protein [Streptomyces xanthophaeus]WKD36519.1 hypothetical protein KO717_34360 [Streptomyces xanthophaeus]